MKKFRIAVLGCGTVGGGVAKIINEIGADLSERANCTVEIARIVELNAAEAVKRFELPADLFVDGSNNVTPEQANATIKEILADDSIDMVVETIGGTSDFVFNTCIDVLNAGKHLGTANKALLAERGTPIFEAAKANGVTIGYEAAVMGAIPVIKTIKESFSGDVIESMSGIMNGTSNYILSRMQNENLSFADALKLAQDAGYAEADPTLDVNGGDASHKIIILMKLAYGLDVAMDDISKVGIEAIDKDDMAFAQEIGATIKLICSAKKSDNVISATVRPMMVKNENVLSGINGATNAVRFQNRYSGKNILVGEGAGSSETASSIVADIVFAARYNKSIDNETATTNYVFGDDKAFEFPYLISFTTEDLPGTTGFITTEIGAKGININTVSHNRHGNDHATFSVATVPCKIDKINDAIESIRAKRPEILVADPKIMPILY